MKNLTTHVLLTTLMILLMVSCGKDNNSFLDLKVEKTEIRLIESNTTEVKITSGSGSYTAESKGKEIVKVSIVSNTLRIEGLKKGEATVLVTDTKTRQTVEVKVNVTADTTTSDDMTMKLAKTNVVEFLEITQKGNSTPISPDKIEDHWGKRIADNTPTELQLKGNNLLIKKPEGITEEYKVKRENDKLYLYDKTSNKMTYFGQFDGNKLEISVGFYSIFSQNGDKYLDIIGQKYGLTDYHNIKKYPEATITWTNMSFQFDLK